MLAILAVAALLFLVAGFVTRAEIGSLRGLARRFAPAVIGLLLVAAPLTKYLVGMVDTIHTRRAITVVLDHELAREPSTALVAVDFSRGRDGVEVLSEVRTPRVLEPGRVKEIQDALGSRLEAPVRLFMPCALTKDVTATGSTTLRPYLSLNGKVATAPLSPDMRILQQAGQVAREVVADRPEITLKDLELAYFPTGPVLVASIESTRPPGLGRIARFETQLRERLGEPTLSVVVRVAESVDITAKGRVLFGEAHFGAASAGEAEEQSAAEAAVRASLQALPNTFVTAIDAVRRESGWAVRADVVAPRVPSPGDVHDVETRAGRAIKGPVQLTVRASTDVLVTGTEYRAAGDVLPAEEGSAPEAQSP